MYDKWGGNPLPVWVTYRMTQDAILSMCQLMMMLASIHEYNGHF